MTRRDFINKTSSVGVVTGVGSRFAISSYSRADQPQQTALPRSVSRAPLRILVIVAHADDMEYNIGGTVAKWVAEGHEVFRAAVTDSARGSFEAGMTVEKLAKIGIHEAEAAARVLGLKGNFFLGFPDGMTRLADEAVVREKLMQLIRRLKANVVVTWDPWARLDDHPDHEIASRAAYWASEFAPFPMFHPQQFGEKGVESCFVTERYYFAKHPLPSATHVVDVSDHLERKIQALLKYESQMRLAYDGYVAYQRTIGVPREQWSKQVSDDNYRQLMGEAIRREAAEFGKPYNVRFAEVFRYVRNEPRYP